MNYLKIHAPWLLTVLASVIDFEKPSIQNFVSTHPASTVAALLGVALAAYYANSPLSKKSAGVDANTAASSPSTKAFPLVLLALLALPVGARAQTAPTASQPNQPVNLYAAGLTYNQSGTPSIAGTALYAHSLNDGSGTYAFTLVDALPTSTKPFTVTTNIGAGIAQKIFTIGTVPLYIPTSAGISWNGPNTGWAWSTGVMGVIKVKGNWRLMPNVRFLGSSVNNQSGIQPIGGILVSWGE